ncbi:MAG: N-acetyltransferase [Gaiellales bacterium]|nr:N-acetyltransferase [Gaiellales bacterium]
MNLFEPVADSRPDDRPWPPLTWPLEPDVKLAGQIVEVTLFERDRDAEALFAALDHDAVWAHVAGRPADPSSYGDALAGAASQGRFPWVVRLVRPLAGLEPGTVIGTSSYFDVSVPDARLEIGFTSYDPRVWGSAVNPAAKLLLLAHAFDALGAGRVQLKTDVRNQRSQRAIARLGARHEGTLRRYQRRSDDTVRDTVLFSILAEEWPAVRAGLQDRLAAALS